MSETQETPGFLQTGDQKIRAQERGDLAGKPDKYQKLAAKRRKHAAAALALLPTASLVVNEHGGPQAVEPVVTDPLADYDAAAMSGMLPITRASLVCAAIG